MAWEWNDWDWADVEWGGGDIGATRLLRFIREGPNVRALADIIDTRAGVLLGALQQISDLFDLDTAVGEQLDFIGAKLGLPRDGLTDPRYRAALRVWRVVLRTNGTLPDLLAIYQAWTTYTPITLRSIPPAEVEIGGQVEPADEKLLKRFLRTAVPGGVRLNVIAHPSTSVLLGDYTPAPLTGTGTVGYHPADPVVGAAPLAHEV